MVFFIELPVMFLLFNHLIYPTIIGMGLVFILYLAFCVLSIKNKAPRPSLKAVAAEPILSFGLSALLGWLFYRGWIDSESFLRFAQKFPLRPELLLTVICVILSVLSVCGISVILETSNFILRRNGSAPVLKARSILCRVLASFFQHRYTVVLPVFVALVLCNWVFLVHGYTTPDGIWEGYALYTNANWARSLGRWAIPFVSLGTFNVVMPIFSFFVCGISISLTAILLFKLWNISSKILMILCAFALAASESVSAQFLYVYMLPAYNAALLGAAACAYVAMRYSPSVKHFLFAACALTLSLACYQSYIGFAVAAIMITIILRAVDGANPKDLARRGFYSLFIGLSSCVLYLIIWKANLLLAHQTAADYGGLQNIGILNTIKSIPQVIAASYRNFMAFLTLSSNIYAIPVAFAILLFVFRIFCKAANKVDKVNIMISLVFILLLPVGMNVEQFISTTYSMTVLMSHQIYLTLFLCAALLERTLSNAPSPIHPQKFFLSLVIAVYCLLNVIGDFALDFSILQSAKFNLSTTQILLTRVMELDEYTEESRIFFAGVPDESSVTETNPLSDFICNPTNIAQSMFWKELPVLYAIEWPKYLATHFGYSSGTFSDEECQRIVQSDQFRQMPCFPKTDCVATYVEDESIIIVKLQDDPYSQE